MKFPSLLASTYRWTGLGLGIVLVGCASSSASTSPPPKPPLPVTQPVELPQHPPSAPHQGIVIIRGGTVMTAAGDIHQPGYVWIENGRIAKVGAGAPQGVPAQAQVIDAGGKTITPGLIDTHSHMGVYALPDVPAHWDGNEMVRPATPEVWAEHAFWPHDPSIWRATAGGVTTVQVLPGSANLFGGRSFVAKLRVDTHPRAMRFPGAPQGLKMACGENPKHRYEERGGPMTRMGNLAMVRGTFERALEYERSWQKYERDLAHWRASEGKDDDGTLIDPPEAPSRDLGLDTLVDVLRGKVWVHNHCYRADEMHHMLDLAKAYGFTIRSFHHGLEAYKLADRLAAEGVAVSTWADWWGFKMEAFDGISYNAAILHAAGAKAIIHSDSAEDIQRLNQEAAKAMAAGNELGLTITPNDALRWITANPAWVLGVHEQTGTLEPGKMADLVVWSGDPFSVYTVAERVLIDGVTVYDRSQPLPESDFELGGAPHEGVGDLTRSPGGQP